MCKEKKGIHENGYFVCPAIEDLCIINSVSSVKRGKSIVNISDVNFN